MGKVAVVTGAAPGQGAAAVPTLAACGVHVVAHGRAGRTLVGAGPIDASGSSASRVPASGCRQSPRLGGRGEACPIPCAAGLEARNDRRRHPPDEDAAVALANDSQYGSGRACGPPTRSGTDDRPASAVRCAVHQPGGGVRPAPPVRRDQAQRLWPRARRCWHPRVRQHAERADQPDAPWVP